MNLLNFLAQLSQFPANYSVATLLKISFRTDQTIFLSANIVLHNLLTCYHSLIMYPLKYRYLKVTFSSTNLIKTHNCGRRFFIKTKEGKVQLPSPTGNCEDEVQNMRRCLIKATRVMKTAERLIQLEKREDENRFVPRPP